MTTDFRADKYEIKKGESSAFTLTLDSDTPITSAVIEIIPSVESYPQMRIIPDEASVTLSDELTADIYTAEDGIFTISIPDALASKEISLSYSAVSDGFSDKNTSAAMITLNHCGTVEELYSQVSITAPPHPYTAVLAAITFSAVSLFLFYRIFLHSR